MEKTNGKEQEFYKEKTWEELDNKLKNFDYTYEFSDDHRTWTEWRKKEEELRKLIRSMAKIGIQRTTDLIIKHESEHGTNFLNEVRK